MMLYCHALDRTLNVELVLKLIWLNLRLEPLLGLDSSGLGLGLRELDTADAGLVTSLCSSSTVYVS